MHPSPLSLDSHSFRKIHLDVADAPNPADANRLACSISYAQDRDEPQRFRVVLGLKLDAEKGAKPPYQGEFEIAGIFRVHEGWPKEKTESLISISGPTLLYGAIREMLINLTSRMEHGPINLRTVSFAELKPAAASPRKKKAVKPKIRQPAKTR